MDESDSLETRLREALAPQASTVGRVIHRALAAPERVVRRGRLLTAPGLAALLAALAFVLFLGLERLRPIPAQRSRITIASVGDIVVADSPAGAWLVRMGDFEPGQPGSSIILTLGSEP